MSRELCSERNGVAGVTACDFPPRYNEMTSSFIEDSIHSQLYKLLGLLATKYKLHKKTI